MNDDMNFDVISKSKIKDRSRQNWSKLRNSQEICQKTNGKWLNGAHQRKRTCQTETRTC